MSRRALLCAVVVAPLVLAGCGGSSAGGAAGSKTVTVFAAASLTEAFSSLGRQFEAAHPGTTVRFSFGASSSLAQQISSGAPADVFASASAKNMDQLVTAGSVDGPKPFATNEAEIVVAPSSAGKITRLADLARPGTKVALCQPEVPCGGLAQEVLGKAKVTVVPVTQGLDVKAVLATVVSGEADAGIVYVTDVKAAAGKVTGVAIPAAVNASTTYPIATVKAGKRASLAQSFEDYVLSADGQRVLTEAGFTRP